MEVSGKQSFTNRVVNVLRLDPATFREIERDTDATGQALAVVVIVAIAQAIGSLGGDRNPLALVIGGAFNAIVGWIVFSIVAYFVATTLFNSRTTTVGRVLRLIGFAQAPKLIGILGFIPIIGWIIGLIAFVWFLAAAVAALRESLDIDTTQAVVTAVVSGLVIVAIGFIIALVLGITFGLTAAVLNLIF